MIDNLASESESFGAILVTIQDKKVNIFDFCSQTIKEIVKEAENFLRILGKAQSKEAWDSLQGWVKHRKVFSTKIRLIIAEPYLNGLIEAAEDAGKSLRVALLVLTVKETRIR